MKKCFKIGLILLLFTTLFGCAKEDGSGRDDWEKGIFSENRISKKEQFEVNIAQQGLQAIKQAYDTYFTINGTTDGYEVEDALDDAGLSEDISGKWVFEVIGNPPKEYIATSNSAFKFGEGKQIKYIVEEGKFTGWGTE